MKIKRKLIVQDSLLDLSMLAITKKRALLPALIKIVGIMIALKILFGEKKK
jgi:hypothetical protein